MEACRIKHILKNDDIPFNPLMLVFKRYPAEVFKQQYEDACETHTCGFMLFCQSLRITHKI